MDNYLDGANLVNPQLPVMPSHLAFTFTNRCNLRCVYCPQGTHPDEFHADTSDQQLDQILNYIETHDVTKVSLGYYGETTMIDGWERHCLRLLDRGLYITLVSNHAKLLKPTEVEVMSRFSELQISLDTVDVNVLKSVRKAVDARTIIYNTQQIQAQAIREGRPGPKIVWTSVLCSDVVFGIVDFVAMAVSCGIKHLNFNFVGNFESARKTLNVFDMSTPDFMRAVELIEQARRLANRHGVEFIAYGDDMVDQRLLRETDIGSYGRLTKRLAVFEAIPLDARIFIYGAGEAARALRRHLAARYNYEFIAFIDSFKSGEMDAVRIYTLEEYSAIAHADDQILICSMYEDAIEASLIERGIENYFKVYSLFKNGFQASTLVPEIDKNIVREGIQGRYRFSGEVTSVGPGYTRLCSSPWTELYFDPKGEVYSCCQRGEVMARLEPDTAIDQILSKPTFMKLRQELLSGENLSPECKLCSITRIVPVEDMAKHIAGLLK